MSSRHGVRPLRLVVVAAVIALISTLFAATAAHAGTGSITGKVTKPSGNALSGLTVGAYKVSNGEYTHVKNVTTRSDGTYTLGSLDRGRYVVAFGENALRYVTEYWNNKPSLETATTIAVSTSRVSSINARMTSGGSITGTIQREGGAPVPHVQVDIFREEDDYADDYHYLKTTEGSADGGYVAGGLIPGCYRLLFTPPAEGPGSDLAVEWLEGRACVDPGEVVTEFTDIQLDPGGSVAGRITGPDGEPIEGAWVFGSLGDGGGDKINFAVADADGRYVMNRMSVGSHSLEFFGPVENPLGEDTGYASEWWDDAYSWNLADPIAVVAGETSTGKNAQLNSSDAPFVNLTRPSISGTPEVGEPLKGDLGRWSPDVSVQPRWFVNGVEVQREGVEFVPEPEHIGQTITLQTGPRGSTIKASSDATAPVAPGGPLVNAVKPSIKAGERVGDTIIIDQGTWTARDVTLTHQLLADGQAVPGATGNWIPATADLLGKRLSVRETASRPGRTSTTVISDETPPITEGIFTNYERPKLVDQPIVGVPLTTTNGAWSSPASARPEAYQYQWFANGAPISGADEGTFTPSGAESGQTLTVKVKPIRSGYRAEWAASETTNGVAEPGVLQIQPGNSYFYGPAAVGRKLEVYTGNGWSPQGLTYSYRWLADDDPIAGATGKTFTVTQAQAGKRLSVEVTGAKDGYTSARTTYAQDVPETTPFGAPQNVRATDQTMTTVDLAWTQVQDAAKYRVSYGIGSGERTKVDVQDVTTTLQWLKAGAEYTIDIAAVRADGTRSAYSPRITVRTTPIPKPTDLRVESLSPTVLRVHWTPVPSVPRYRMSYGIGAGTRTPVDAWDDDGIGHLQDLRPNTTYSIDVASLLMTGQRSGYTPRIEFTTDPFLPPTNFASPGATSSTIDLTWTKAPSATSYRIYYGIGSGTRTRVDVGNRSSRTLTGLKSGTAYDIDIAALMSDGTKSPYTPRITVNTD